MNRYTYITVLIVALITALLGCSTPKKTTPKTDIAVPSAWKEQPPGMEPYRPGWLDDFEDERLPSLVSEAVKNNYDLKIAAARVEEAAAQARIAGAPLYPNINADVNAAHTGFPWSSPPSNNSGFNNFGANLNLSWEIDLWGQLRATKAAAVAGTRAAQFDRDAAQLSLAAQTTKAWFSAIESRMQIAIAESTVKSFEKTREVAQRQYASGKANRFAFELTTADEKQAQSNLTQRKADFAAAKRALEVLLGRYPTGEIEAMDSLPILSHAVPAGIPSEVISRRPDLRASEWRLFSSENSVFSAKAQWYPSISLTSQFGGTSEAFKNLFDSSNLFWTIVGNLTQPIFEGGQISGQIQLTEAQRKEAAASYAKLVLTAFQEIENALNLEQNLALEEKTTQDAYDHLCKAYNIAFSQYKYGKIDIISVLDTQRNMLATESNLLTIKLLRLNNRVDLLLALGGDCEAPPPIEKGMANKFRY